MRKKPFGYRPSSFASAPFAASSFAREGGRAVTVPCESGRENAARGSQRSGSLPLGGLSAPVQVRYDERGVPHIQAANESDLYRALGYVHAQDRLFQMEIARRLARGELAEILGPKRLDTDRLFRTLGIRARADAAAAALDKSTPAYQAVAAYLDGINQFQATRAAPLEFQVLGIEKRPCTPQDTLSVAGYLAYSFASAFRTEPVMSHIRDQLGARAGVYNLYAIWVDCSSILSMRTKMSQFSISRRPCIYMYNKLLLTGSVLAQIEKLPNTACSNWRVGFCSTLRVFSAPKRVHERSSAIVRECKPLVYILHKKVLWNQHCQLFLNLLIN